MARTAAAGTSRARMRSLALHYPVPATTRQMAGLLNADCSGRQQHVPARTSNTNTDVGLRVHHMTSYSRVTPHYMHASSRAWCTVHGARPHQLCTCKCIVSVPRNSVGAALSLSNNDTTRHNCRFAAHSVSLSSVYPAQYRTAYTNKTSQIKRPSSSSVEE